jgi:hypothetical protein
MGSPTARSLVAHELTHVAQQRAFGNRLPHENTAHGQELERIAASAEHHPQLPLAIPHAAPSSAAVKAEEMATAQRKPASSPPTPSNETTTINFPAAIQRAANKSTPQPKSTAARKDEQKSETDLEELASQLYGRISRRLRRELLVDRERAGVMVDLR